MDVQEEAKRNICDLFVACLFLKNNREKFRAWKEDINHYHFSQFWSTQWHFLTAWTLDESCLRKRDSSAATLIRS